MFDDTKLVLWGSMVGAFTVIATWFLGGPSLIVAILMVPVMLSIGVLAAILRDKKFTDSHDRDLEKRYQETERMLADREKLKSETQDAVKNSEQQIYAAEYKVSRQQLSGVELWQAQRKRKMEASAEASRTLRVQNRSMGSFIHKPNLAASESKLIRADLDDALTKAASLDEYLSDLNRQFGDSLSPEQSRTLLRFESQSEVLARQVLLNKKWLIQSLFKNWKKEVEIITGVYGEKINLSVSAELQTWLDTRIKPSPQPFGVSHEGAEHLVAEWLAYLGEGRPKVTSFAGDGGVDVETDDSICQVKNYGQAGVTASEMRDLLGAATAAGKRPIMFTSSRLTGAAGEFAKVNGIVCVKYNAESAFLSPLGDAGVIFLEQGYYEEKE